MSPARRKSNCDVGQDTTNRVPRKAAPKQKRSWLMLVQPNPNPNPNTDTILEEDEMMFVLNTNKYHHKKKVTPNHLISAVSRHFLLVSSARPPCKPKGLRIVFFVIFSLLHQSLHRLCTPRFDYTVGRLSSQRGFRPHPNQRASARRSSRRCRTLR